MKFIKVSTPTEQYLIAVKIDIRPEVNILNLVVAHKPGVVLAHS